MKVKLCGQTRPEDVAYSLTRGADLCGVVVAVPSSKRTLTVEQAAPIFHEFGQRTVALTADADDALYRRIAEELKPCAVQLTANEPPEEVARITDAYRFTVFKSLHLPQEGEPGAGAEEILEKMEAYLKAGAEYFVLDTLVPDMYGGSGKTSDWAVAARILADAPGKTFLAGGIHPGNAAEAAALHPYGIDLASGVEDSPGIKSRQKIDDLLDAVKEYR